MHRLFISLATAALLSACSDTETLSTTPVPEVELQSFNVTDIESIDSKTINISWENTQATSGVNYDVCLKDETQTKDCFLLGTVVDETSYQHTFDSVFQIVTSDFYVVAHKGDKEALSSEIKIDEQDTLSFVSYLNDPTNYDNDEFGYALAASDDASVIAVGSYLGRNVSVYQFNTDTKQYELETQLNDATANENTGFGRSISLSADGKLLVIGAPDTRDIANNLPGAGAAFVYRHDGIWTLETILTASNKEEWDEFGQSVSASGDASTILVGSTGESSSALTNGDETLNDRSRAGAAYVFHYDGSWKQTGYLKPTHHYGETFGLKVRLNFDGTYAAVSDIDNTDTTGINGTPSGANSSSSGGVFVYKLDNTWQYDSFIKPHNTHTWQNFGGSLDFANNNTLIVGAYGDMDEIGAVFTFELNGNWVQVDYLTDIHNIDGNKHQFGFSLDADSTGETLAIGSKFHSDSQMGITADPANPIIYSRRDEFGAVSIYKRKNAGWEQSDYLKSIAPDDNEELGSSVATARHGNTIIVGVPRDNSATSDPTLNDGRRKGSVMVFH